MNKKHMSKQKAKLLAAEKAKSRGLNYLKREQIYAKRAISLGEQEWKKMLKKISDKTMKEELLYVWNNFEKIVDYKDVEITLYMDWMQLELDHSRISQSHHNESISNLINLYREHCELFMKDATQTVEDSTNVWRTGVDNMKRKSLKNIQHLEAMRYNLEQRVKQAEQVRVMENFSVKNEKEVKYQHALNVTEARFFLIIEKYYKNIHQILRNYAEDLEARRRNEAEIRFREEELHKDIVRNEKRLTKIAKIINLLNDKLNLLYMKEGATLTNLTREKEILHNHFLFLRDKLVHDIDNDVSKTKICITYSKKRFEILEELARKGTNMLKYLKSCRKYESLAEKILPYRSCVGLEDQMLKENLKQMREYIRDDQLEELIKKLGLFWSKLAISNASRYTLNEERVFLKLENKRLQKEIHRHCQCLDCPSLPPIPKRAGKVPYTEGKHMIRKLEPLKTLKFDFENEKNLQ